MIYYLSFLCATCLRNALSAAHAINVCISTLYTTYSFVNLLTTFKIHCTEVFSIP
jgi:hypothetical protein